MNPMPPEPSGSRQSHPTALVVDPALPNLLAVLSALSAMGFDTSMANTYQEAKAALDTQGPTLLVTGLKLREYNGLQLVLRGTAAWPGLAAVVMADAPDPVLQSETERLGATFVVMPTSSAELEAALSRTVLSARSGGAPPIQAPFERRTGRRGESTAPEPRAERRRDLAAALRAAAGSQ
jgi:DNA-binding NtrC family response regulator